MTKISSQIMLMCQVKASSHFSLHSTLHFYTSGVLSMEQICCRSLASSFKTCRKQDTTDVQYSLVLRLYTAGQILPQTKPLFSLASKSPWFRAEPAELQCGLCHLRKLYRKQKTFPEWSILSYNFSQALNRFPPPTHPLTLEENRLKASVFHAFTLF